MTKPSADEAHRSGRARRRRHPGLGRAFAQALLARGAAKVYAVTGSASCGSGWTSRTRTTSRATAAAVEAVAEEVLADEVTSRSTAVLSRDLELLYPDLRRQ